MNFHRNNFFALAIICTTLSLSFFSCEEDDHHHHDDGSDTVAPQISITSPTEAQIFNNGDTVFLRGTLTDDKSLHDLDIIIKNISNDSLLYSKSQSVHDLLTYNVDFFWKSSVADHTNAIVIFVAEDHGENITADTVNIHIMP